MDLRDGLGALLLQILLEGGRRPRRAEHRRSGFGARRRRTLQERPDLLLRYESALFLDDDVEIGADGINALFRAMRAQGLDLAHPALTKDSRTAWPFLKKLAAGNGVVRVTSVEIMAPLMTRRALERAGWVFAESVSGWGSDLLLGPVVRSAFGPESIGVIGSVAVRHAAPVDVADGAFYAFLRRYGVDPGQEANRVASSFGVERFLRPLAPGEAGPAYRGAQEGRRQDRAMEGVGAKISSI